MSLSNSTKNKVANIKDHFITSNKLRLITYNISKNSTHIDSLASEISKPNQNIVLVLNETTFLKNLEQKYKLFGVRHDNDAEFMSGLCLYVSNRIRQFTTTPKKGRFYFSCKISFPPSNPDHDPTVIGIVATYRNPKLNTNSFLNDDYFNEIEAELSRLYLETDLTYLLGDINCYHQRYKTSDLTSLVEADPCNPAVKSYHRLFRCFTGNFHSMFSEPTHFPRSTCSKTKEITASQLDYIIVQSASSKYPKGKSKTIIGLDKADHLALNTIINIPKFTPKKIEFSPNIRLVEPDYELIDKTLQKYLEHNPIRNDHVDEDFQQIENLKYTLLESSAHVREMSVPNNLSNPYLIRLALLQDKGNRFRKLGDIKNYRATEDEIRTTLSDYMVAEAKYSSQDKSSSMFHAFAGALAKPMKCDFGKNVMTSKSIDQMATEINDTYFDPAPDDWTTKLPLNADHRDLLLKKLYDHDFREAVKTTLKPPKYFKLLQGYEALLCYQLTKAIIETGVYPSSLKISKCTILPSRSIFSAYHAEAKVIERFFCEQLVDEVEKLDNLAYRRNLSCTSLLISQFNAIAIEPKTYAFNGDIQKAFNSMSRKSVLDSIENSHLRNILSSWMDRSNSPYLINWGNSFKEISRASWSSGIEPGSNLGPPLFLKGLNCRKVYLRAIPGQKNLFADDGAPLYKLISSLTSDAADYIRHVNSLHMKLHTTGSKAMSFMALGKVDHNLGDIELVVDSKDYTIKRVFSTKQLGLCYSADKNGKYLISISHYIAKLKNAYTAICV